MRRAPLGPAARRLLTALSICAGVVLTACGDSGGPSNGTPSARFASVCAALRCDFTDNSLDDAGVTSWSWTFGDGGSASDANPVHSFAQPGTYDVTLRAADAEGLSNSVTHQVVATAPVVAHLSCSDGSAPGGVARCSLPLDQAGGVKVTLTTSGCDAHGNTFRLVAPVADTLTTDGCYAPAGTEKILAGPFPAGTEIDAEMVGPRFANPPQVLVHGAYPEWTLTYEDGADSDFNDLTLTITALPNGN